MNLKVLLPIDNFTLLTNLSPTEVKQKLESTIKESGYKPDFLFYDTRIRFEGQVLDRSFQISRKSSYGREVLPELKGEISNPMGKTEIAIKMRPTLNNRIFIGIWMGITGLICVGIILLTTFKSKQAVSNIFPWDTKFPFVFFVMGYVVLMIGFKFESYKTKRFLKQLLEAEEG